MKRATVRHLRWDEGPHTRITIQSSALRFHVGETIEVVFADLVVTGFVLSAKRIRDHRVSQMPRAEFTIQVAVEPEGDAPVCICIPPNVDSTCEADHAVYVEKWSDE